MGFIAFSFSLAVRCNYMQLCASSPKTMYQNGVHRQKCTIVHALHQRASRFSSGEGTMLLSVIELCNATKGAKQAARQRAAVRRHDSTSGRQPFPARLLSCEKPTQRASGRVSPSAASPHPSKCGLMRLVAVENPTAFPCRICQAWKDKRACLPTTPVWCSWSWSSSFRLIASVADSVSLLQPKFKLPVIGLFLVSTQKGIVNLAFSRFALLQGGVVARHEVGLLKVAHFCNQGSEVCVSHFLVPLRGQSSR